MADTQTGPTVADLFRRAQAMRKENPQTAYRDIAKQLVKSVTELGYTFRLVRKDSAFITAPRWTWPQTLAFFMWRSLVYPGAEHTLTLQAAGAWTRLSLTTRLLCETGQHPPTGHPQDVDFQTFVLNQTYTMDGQKQTISAPTSILFRRQDADWMIELIHTVPIPEQG